MASTKGAWANGTFTITIASLATGSSRQSDAVDLSSLNGLDLNVYVKFKTNAAGTSSTGYVVFRWMARTGDGTEYVDAGGATDAAVTPVNAPVIGSSPAVANATTYIAGPFSLSKILGSVPKFGALVVENQSGATLSATGGDHEATYEAVSLTTS